MLAALQRTSVPPPVSRSHEYPPPGPALVDAATTATGLGAHSAAVVPASDNACGAAGRAAVATRRSESITAEQA